jgi:hypothetical protein
VNLNLDFVCLSSAVYDGCVGADGLRRTRKEITFHVDVVNRSFQDLENPTNPRFWCLENLT